MAIQQRVRGLGTGRVIQFFDDETDFVFLEFDCVNQKVIVPEGAVVDVCGAFQVDGTAVTATAADLNQTAGLA